MNRLKVNYSAGKRYELSFEAPASAHSQVHCPSFKKMEGYKALVTSSNYDDGVNYFIRYSKICTDFIPQDRDDAIQHYRTLFKGNESSFNVHEVSFSWDCELGFGTEISEILSNPHIKGNSIAEKFLDFENNIRE